MWCFQCLSVGERCVHVEGRAASSWINDRAGNFVNELIDGAAVDVTRRSESALEVSYLVKLEFGVEMLCNNWQLVYIC